MITRILTAALLLASANAFAYTDCSDATGENRVVENNFRGGPMPQPTTVVDDIKIYEGNQLVSESKTLNNGTKQPGPLVANFLQASKNVLSSQVNGLVEDYTIRVSITVANNNFPGGGPTPPLYLMICHADNVPVP